MGVIVPPLSGQTTWNFKYLKSDGFDSLGDLTDDIEQAKLFNLDSGSQDGTNAWIERFFNEQVERQVSGRVFKRDYFGGFQKSTRLDERKMKHVTKSDNVIVTRQDVMDGFTMCSLGDGEDKTVFLAHKRTGSLPSRFHVKSTTQMDLDVSKLLNLSLYERGLRSEITDAPYAKNLTYKNTECGNWLVGGKLKCRLVQEYNGWDEDKIGYGLEPGSNKFVCSLDWNPESPESTHDEIFNFGPTEVRDVSELPLVGEIGVIYANSQDSKRYRWQLGGDGGCEFVETQDDWNNNMGISGSFTVHFFDLDTDNPKARIVSCDKDCFVMARLPDARTNEDVVKTWEYHVVETPSDSSIDVESQIFVEEDEDTQTTTTKKVLTFIPTMRFEQKTLAIDIGEDYVASNGLYVNCGNPGTMETQYVIMLMDFNGSRIGLLPYGYASIPKDMDDAGDQAHYVETLSQINEQRRA